MASKIHFSGPCSAKILIQLKGKIVAPSKAAWRGGSEWINVEYVNGLTIDGNGEGSVLGDGPTWWQCPRCSRPTYVSCDIIFLMVQMLHFHSCNDLNVRNLRILNSPRSHVSVNMCNHATFSYISISSPATSPNTDGFDISHSNNILIQDSNIKSGDDCIAVNGGSTFINATRVTCGPGHGISVGSLGGNGANDQVSDVHVRNCTFIGTQNGARIKTVPGGSGYARKITFEHIVLVNVMNPIIIDQAYTLSTLDTAVSVRDVTYRGFTGTSYSDIAIDLKCSSSGCFKILLDQNNIVSAQPGKKTSSFCRNAHGIVRNTIPIVPCLSN
ncbi:probable polygalacturonase At3g15720 [Medicago truncatula]|uniref:probable polygalacturonase At3g15720 n=1 Tax=Medicago truncatula TaxID=3880 RepID=UPI000D2F1E12|nr:probable polygalacturonase At3g15720 [Medicago truncatula]